MAYYRPRNPQSPGDPSEAQFPGPRDIWDTMLSPLTGLWEGLGGKNRNFEQYVRDKGRKNKGLAPRQRPGRGVINWLGRTMTGR